MQVTTNTLNNKIDLSKVNTQFASGKVNPDDSASSTEDFKVVDVSTVEKYAKTNNKLSDEAKVIAKHIAEAKLDIKVAKTFLNTLSSMADVIMSIPSDSSGKSLVVEALITCLELGMMVDKKAEFEAHPTLAIFKEVTESRNEDQKASGFTVENGELCYKGVPVRGGIFEDSEVVDKVINALSDTAFDSSIKSVNTLEFGTDENGMSNNLQSLLVDITADIRDGDMSNIETYLEKLNEYEDLILSVQADLEYAKDPEVAITKYTGQEVAYEACLAMQPNILQPTLLDYVS